MKKVPREITINIEDELEEFLAERDITIDNPDSKDIDDPAIICGSDSDILELDIASVLEEHGFKVSDMIQGDGDETPKEKMGEISRKAIDGIINVFEKFLKEKDVKIDNPEKKIDDKTIIFGKDCKLLEKGIVSVLKSYGIKISPILGHVVTGITTYYGVDFADGPDRSVTVVAMYNTNPECTEYEAVIVCEDKLDLVDRELLKQKAIKYIEDWVNEHGTD